MCKRPLSAALPVLAVSVSNSCSDSESDAPAGINTHYNHPGVMIAAATGDDGSSSGTDTQDPASSPTVVAVGGTSTVTNPGNPFGYVNLSRDTPITQCDHRHGDYMENPEALLRWTA